MEIFHQSFVPTFSHLVQITPLKCVFGLYLDQSYGPGSCQPLVARAGLGLKDLNWGRAQIFLSLAHEHPYAFYPKTLLQDPTNPTCPSLETDKRAGPRPGPIPISSQPKHQAKSLLMNHNNQSKLQYLRLKTELKLYVFCVWTMDYEQETSNSSTDSYPTLSSLL